MKIPMNEIVDMLKSCYKYEILEDEMTNNECDLCDRDLMRGKPYLVCICSTEKQYKKDNYIKNNCIEPKSMQQRHDDLVIERHRRGMVAKGTFIAPDISYLPEYQQNYKIDVDKNLKLLINKCPECKKRYEKLVNGELND